MPIDPSRRCFLRAAVAASSLYAGIAPPFVRADRSGVVGGVASGDVTSHRAVVWARGDRPSRMVVEYALDEGFGNARQRLGPVVGEAGDFTGRVDLYGLPHAADVHYTAAHYYHPDRARFQDFKPFWEFVSGPLNAGTFGPNVLDDTFGPRVVFQKTPPEGEFNLPPSAGMQFYGEVAISGADEVMTVELKDASGATLIAGSSSPGLEPRAR